MNIIDTLFFSIIILPLQLVSSILLHMIVSWSPILLSPSYIIITYIKTNYIIITYIIIYYYIITILSLSFFLHVHQLCYILYFTKTTICINMTHMNTIKTLHIFRNTSTHTQCTAHVPVTFCMSRLKEYSTFVLLLLLLLLLMQDGIMETLASHAHHSPSWQVWWIVGE